MVKSAIFYYLTMFHNDQTDQLSIPLFTLNVFIMLLKLLLALSNKKVFCKFSKADFCVKRGCKQITTSSGEGIQLQDKQMATLEF